MGQTVPPGPLTTSLAKRKKPDRIGLFPIGGDEENRTPARCESVGVLSTADGKAALAEIVEARKYIETVDFTDPKVLEAATSPSLDSRIRAISTHFQTVSRLLNKGVLEEELFAGYIATAPRFWNAIQPAIEVERRRARTPLYLDLQYLAYRRPHDVTIANLLKEYPKEFVEAAGLTNVTAAPIAADRTQ